jgi:hypothetical protein
MGKEEREMKRRRSQYVSQDELEACRADSEYETKQDWIAEFVVCRECGQKRASIATKHLESHQMTQKEYRAKWPSAPIYSDLARANVNAAANRYAAAHRRDLRDSSARWRGKLENKPKLKAQGKRATARRRVNPEPHRTYDRNYYAKTKIPRATDTELELFLANPNKLDYVVCLEALEDGSICRAKLKDIGCAHIPKIHGKTAEQYQESHPGAPIKAQKKKGGRPCGMTTATQQEAVLLLQYIEQFAHQHGTKRGAMPYAAGKVYGRIESHKAVARARKTLANYRKKTIS